MTVSDGEVSREAYRGSGRLNRRRECGAITETESECRAIAVFIDPNPGDLTMARMKLGCTKWGPNRLC